LTAHLIKEGYGIKEITEASRQWVSFIRPDYYVGRALEDAGIDAQEHGFTSDLSCFTDRCNEPFYIYETEHHSGGCGGMDELIPADS